MGVARKRARKIVEDDDDDDIPARIGRPRAPEQPRAAGRSMTPALADLLAELEIKAISIQRYRGPMETMAVETMEHILARYGYAHLKMVLMSIVETANNKRELVAPTIWAVSDLVRAHPGWSGRVSDWLAAFDKVDLGQLCAFAKLNARAVKVRHGLAALLFGFLKTQMDRPAERVAA